MKVLNLYAGIGGNRKLWEDVEVTAVEIDPNIADNYRKFYPLDTVIVSDAHQYLLDHFKEFDFIWSSPPCPTHSKISVNFQHHNIPPRYPDMKLYEEILFLKHYYSGKWVVENVFPFYEPLIPAIKRDRHLFWSNFYIPATSGKVQKQTILRNQRDKKNGVKSYIKDFADIKEVDYSQLENVDRHKVINNCVLPETGLIIFNCARGIITKQNEKQITIFDE